MPTATPEEEANALLGRNSGERDGKSRSYNDFFCAIPKVIAGPGPVGVGASTAANMSPVSAPKRLQARLVRYYQRVVTATVLRADFVVSYH